MKVYVFPGQGAQFSGMGKDLFEEIKGDEYSVMGMPIKQLNNYYKLNEK